MKEWGHLLEHYQRLEQTLSGQVEALRAQLDQFRAAARPTVVGFVKVTAAAEGHWPDGWSAPEVALTLELLRPSSRPVLRGWRPPGSTPGSARLWLDRQPAATVEVAEGSFELAAAIRGDAGARLTVRVECAPVGARVRGADTRALAYVWVDLVVDAGAIGD